MRMPHLLYMQLEIEAYYKNYYMCSTLQMALDTKIIVSITTFSVESNGELLIVQNIVRNGSLWNNIDFEKRVILSLKY